MQNGEILFEASPDLERHFASQSDMQEVMLLDLSKGEIQRLTEDRSKDSYPSFFKESSVLFASQRPCENSLAENCPSQLFTVNKENGDVSKFGINLSGLKKKGIDLKDSDYSIEYPNFNPSRNYLSVVVSVPNSFLVIYDLKNEEIVYSDRISGSSTNFQWSPNGNYLAYCHPVLKGIVPTWVNTIIDVEANEETALSLSDDKLKFRSWSLNGNELLLTKRYENGNGKWIKDAYRFDWLKKVNKKINSKELPAIEDWIKIISYDQYLVQKVDHNETLDLWIIDSIGNEIQRLTNDGHLKSVSDTRIN